MKKLKMLCAVALAFAVAAVMPLGSSAGQKKMAQAGGNAAGFHQNLSFYGSTVKRVVLNATARLITVGEGFLDAICVVNGATGQYSIAFDSAEGASGLNADVANTTAMGVVISPKAWVRLDSAANPSGSGCWVPEFGPVRFQRGLVGHNSAATHVGLFYVHSSTGLNPGYLDGNLP